MKQTKTYTLLVLSLLSSLLMWAGDTGKLYTSGKLSSSLINCMVQDRHGYIWVGTEYGLNKFDGYRFTTFFHDSKDSTSVSDNIISSFLTDKDGHLWVGTSRGLMRYRYETGDFKRYNFTDGRQPRIYSLVEDRHGDILIGTAGYGLYQLRKGHATIDRTSLSAVKDSDIFFTHIYIDNRQQLWQSSHLPTFTRFSHTGKDGKRISKKNFHSPCGAPVAFFQRRKDILLIVCMYGIIYYDYRTDRIADAGYDFGIYRGCTTINNATFDHRGNLYLSTSEHGALLIRNGKGKVEPAGSLSSKMDLGTAFVNDIIEDKNHNLWIGCYKKGLYQLSQGEEAFNTWSFSEQNYIIGSCVSSIAQGENGITWCTVQNSGVYGFDPTGKIVAHPQSPMGTSLIYKDHRGNYWLGNGNALYSYDPATGKAQQKLNFTSAGIYCMADDKEGNLYISVYSKGLYIYNVESGAVRTLNMSQRSSKGFLCNDWVRALSFDRDGRLWIGTSNGVGCLNTQTWAFNGLGWNQILKNKQANALCEGTDGEIFIGTDEGLFLYDHKRGNGAIPFPHAEILDGKQICSIVRDRKGDLWISTTMGIWQYSKTSRKFIGHINGNGLKSKEYILGAVMQQPNGLIGFGTEDGITTFMPDRVRANRMTLGKVHLTNFLMDGKAVDCLSDSYSVPYAQNSFTLEFSLLTFNNTENISYQYRINGGPWNSTPEGINAVSFNKLKPGNYTLEVRAAGNGAYSDSITTISIRVEDPWYSTVWAYAAYLMAVLAIGTYIVLAYEHRRKTELEETKMKFLINATHDIRSPLTLIMGPLNKLKTRLTDKESQQDLQTIDRNAQRLLLLVNQILDERKIDKNQMQLHCQETNLRDFVRAICSLFNFNAKERGITIALHGDETLQDDKPLLVWIDRINFDKVVSNLLSNAMKYTFDGGSINITLGKTDTHAVIKVTDTGIGFKEEKTDRLFERFYQGKSSSDLHIEGTGIGLNLSRAIVRMHGGTIKAYNRTDGTRGACLEVAIPLGKDHLKPNEIIAEENTKTADSIERKTNANRNFNILVVDDDAEIAQYIRNELGEWYRFGYAPNGKEGLKMLLTGKYDLVVSDVMMPEMDGITMLKKIKGNTNISDIPVILLTSKGEVENRLEGLRRGADAFLAKPFSMEELHILIDNLVDNVRRLRGKYTHAQGQAEKIENIEVKGNNDVLMDRIMKCINANLDNPDFNVERLTEEVCISRAQLHRKMKEIAGVSTGEFIRNLRLQQAARLIEEGKVNITQVAYAVGFNNQTHFSTVFKKHFGMTPTEYAETKRNE